MSFGKISLMILATVAAIGAPSQSVLVGVSAEGRRVPHKHNKNHPPFGNTTSVSSLPGQISSAAFILFRRVLGAMERRKKDKNEQLFQRVRDIDNDRKLKVEETTERTRHIIAAALVITLV